MTIVQRPQSYASGALSTATAHINRIATAVPPADVHLAFLAFARLMLQANPARGARLERMIQMAGIEHRYSCVPPESGFYKLGAFPGTGARMRAFGQFAPRLAEQAIQRLAIDQERDRITHLIVTSCTGFTAPGLDLEIIGRCGLKTSVERLMIGFMGCYAAINAMKTARHIVRSEPQSRVLVVCLELCSLHLRETTDLEELLSFLLFADGCAAALVTAEPHGFAIDGFNAMVAPKTEQLITWDIGDRGFEMVLSSRVPGAIKSALGGASAEALVGAAPSTIDLWGVHPGGRSVLDAVERVFALPAAALSPSRDVLMRYGNMSSATVMFVLEAMLRAPTPAAGKGCAMSFGPGLVAECMAFHRA